MRHGEVALDTSKRISSKEFSKYINRYNSAGIKSPRSSKEKTKKIFDTADIILCSNLHRSTESVKVFNKIVLEESTLFREAELPNLGHSFLKFKPKTWLVISRLLWLLGYSKDCESFKDAKKRAQLASQKLLHYSKEHQTIVLVGHGLFNRLIKKELLLSNYIEKQKLQHKNWSYGIYSSQ